MPRPPSRGVLLALGLLLAGTFAGCSGASEGAAMAAVEAAGPVAAPQPPAEPAAQPASVALRGGLRTADLAVTGRDTLPPPLRRRVARTPGVTSALTLSLATAPVAGRMLTLGAVDPASYRRLTPKQTARADAVWQRVAEGDLALDATLARELRQPLGGDLRLGDLTESPTLRVGAHASLTPRIDGVVNLERGAQLGMSPANALLVSVGGADPADVAERLRRVLGPRATVSELGTRMPDQGQQTASLAGGSVAEAVGSFRYRWFDDGSVVPDPAWVAANLRTEQVPILGSVTCHRVMLPRLRGALQEVVGQGLAGTIDTGDFGGCYSPRFIDGDPARGLSLHTWGIAVDLNVQGNLRGTTGEIDRRVVDIFKRWGFAWGGDWSYTDPMHFELAVLR